MKLTKAQRANIRTAEQKAGLACLLHGHPRIVHLSFGTQVTCARCGGILGDTLAGSMDVSGYAIVGHQGGTDAPCHNCRNAVNALTRTEKVHLPKDVRAWVKQVAAL